MPFLICLIPGLHDQTAIACLVLNRILCEERAESKSENKGPARAAFQPQMTNAVRVSLEVGASSRASVGILSKEAGPKRSRIDGVTVGSGDGGAGRSNVA